MCYANYRFLLFLHRRQLRYATEGIEFMKKTINLYLNCRFYGRAKKRRLMKDLNILNVTQSRLSKNK